jgi:hypothetical protein
VRRCKNTLDGPADICSGVNQGAVYVEKVNPKARNHAGCGLSPPINPGMLVVG